MHAKVTVRSLYRKALKASISPPFLQSSDILALMLRFRKSLRRQYDFCSMFGLVPTSLSVWVDYSGKLVSKTLREKSVPQFRVE